MRRRRFVIGFGAFAAVGVVTGGVAASQVTILPKGQPIWQPQTVDLGNQGALYRFLLLNSDDGIRVLCTAAVLPRSTFRAKILAQAERPDNNTTVQDLARASNAAVAINGGFFNGAFSPDGLLTVDGKTIGRARSDWMGALTIDKDGNAQVSTDGAQRAAYAVQGNPMLVEPGGNMGIHRESNLMAARTVIAQSGDMIVAMVTSPVSLFRLAYALIEHPEALSLSHIDAALNLSGSATTSFYAKLPDGSEVNVPASWINRDVVSFYVRDGRR
jgi:exopolysaccharide biosynthesis protein